VSRSEVKIGAGELSAVTQLFTEPYMVGFLLGNALGAWWAARRLSGADLDGAGGEAGLRRKVAIPGVPLDSLRFVQDAPATQWPPAGTPARPCRGGPAGPNSPASDEAPSAGFRDDRDDSGYGRPDSPASDEATPAAGERARSLRGDGCADDGVTAPGWRPAVGAFGGWPEHLGALKILDPCCGSGHFLVAAFLMLVPMRMAREGLAPRDAVDAVLRDNLYGLELDPRCVELAAFALAAWTYPGAEGYRPLPELNVACSGLAPNATKEQWTALAELAASAGGMPPERDLFGAEDTLLSAPLRNSLDALHELFGRAPELGSLIDPHALKADLFRSDFESVRTLFAAALERERMTDEQTEHAVAARGMARAAELLAGRYHLVITNVPYLARGRQGETLRAFCRRHYPDAKNDLATVFLERCLELCVEGGAASLVLPQNWLFLTGYRILREKLLKTETKRTAHGPLRTDPAVLQVAVARLSGYRWPAEQDPGMELADEQREWVRRCEPLHSFADSDGIVCIPPVRGESSAGERILQLLTAAFGDAWSDRMLTRLLTEAGSPTLDDWLRNRFFEQHCARFHHRPFVWHVWDGRKRDGFHALVGYHKLAKGGGKGRQCLEALTWSYLGDWITRQQDGVKRGEACAEERLAAALGLRERLAAILEGEPPHDLFIRWKPIEAQPVGWEPDADDGVRLNLRPFLAADLPGGRKGAGILRSKPNVHWRKDRGREPFREQERFPWFWRDGEFTGERVNDVHLPTVEKLKYRPEGVLLESKAPHSPRVDVSPNFQG